MKNMGIGKYFVLYLIPILWLMQGIEHNLIVGIIGCLITGIPITIMVLIKPEYADPSKVKKTIKEEYNIDIDEINRRMDQYYRELEEREKQKDTRMEKPKKRTKHKKKGK